MSNLILDSTDDFKKLNAVFVECEQRLFSADYSAELHRINQSLAKQQTSDFSVAGDMVLVDSQSGEDAKTRDMSHARSLVHTASLRESMVSGDRQSIRNDRNKRQVLFGAKTHNDLFSEGQLQKTSTRPSESDIEESLNQFAQSVADSAIDKLICGSE